MRRFTSAALVVLVSTALVPGSASADVVGTGPFLIARPALSWPCAPMPVHIDDAGAPSPWHVEMVRQALARFETATGRPWPLTDDPAAPVVIRWHDPSGHRGALAVLGADATNYRGADIQLSPDIDPAWFLSTVLHELGHLGGLEHVKDRRNVMGLDPGKPFERFGVGDLVGLLMANRACATAQRAGSASTAKASV